MNANGNFVHFNHVKGTRDTIYSLINYFVPKYEHRFIKSL